MEAGYGLPRFTATKSVPITVRCAKGLKAVSIRNDGLDRCGKSLSKQAINKARLTKDKFQ